MATVALGVWALVVGSRAFISCDYWISMDMCARMTFTDQGMTFTIAGPCVRCEPDYTDLGDPSESSQG